MRTASAPSGLAPGGEASPRPRGRPHGTTLAALLFLWAATGVNFLGFKVAVGELDPFTLTALRLGAAALILLPVAVWRGMLRVPRRTWKGLAVTSVLFLVMGQGLLVYGITGMPSGYAALLTASVPPLIVLVRWAWKRDKPDARTLGGVAVGFAGLVLVLAGGGGGGGTVAPLSVAAVAGSALAWAVGVVWSADLDTPDDPLATTTVQMIAASVLLAGLALAFDPAPFALVEVGAGGWLAMAWLVLVGSVVGYGAFVVLQTRVPPALSNSFFYTSPVIALLLGAALLDEPFGAIEAVGAASAVLGVMLILSGGPGAEDGDCGQPRGYGC